MLRRPETRPLLVSQVGTRLEEFEVLVSEGEND